MKRFAFMLCALSFLSARSSAQQEPSEIHQHSTPPADARFEIVQSELAAKWTFRLDRITGHVAQLVKTADDAAWEDMEVIDLPYYTTDRPRFQIFTSGLAARHTFLIDTTSGKTWVITNRTRSRTDGTHDEVAVWQPFAK
jgi:hypothetical protein